LIFHDRKAIFLHIGKTAGSAIENFFAPTPRDASQANLDIIYGWDEYRQIFLQHATLETVKSICSKKIFKEYFKFSIVRNPFDRIISVYSYDSSYFIRRFGSFSGFIFNLPIACKLQTAIGGGHLCRQVDFVFDKDGQRIDFVAKFEGLNRELPRLASCLKVESIELPSPVKSSHLLRKMFLSQLDAKMVRVIQDVYRDDFERFDYSPMPPV
jgi:Sulfotransferase family